MRFESFILSAACGLGIFFAGCAATPVPLGSRLVVTTPTEFYRNGPAQDGSFAFQRSEERANSSGPDFQLPSGTSLTMMKREFGFSKVMTETGDVGYVANEMLQPAPPIVRVAPAEVRRQRSVPGRPKSTAPPREERLDLSDIPLPLPS